jgi:protoporphyrinogen oxidase
MFTNQPHAEFVVLGGGISGLSLAWLLGARSSGGVVVLERNPQVGGLAASVPWQGIPLDLGSHRIHPGCDPAALAWMRGCLNGDLRARQRRGAILVEDRFLPYPPSLVGLGRAFGVRQTCRFARDFVQAHLTRLLDRADSGTFAGYLRQRVGDGLFESFYAPYARKLWALPPDRLSFEPAVARMHRVHGLAGRAGRRSFYYPRGGMGRLADALRDGITARGGTVVTNAEVIELDSEAGAMRVGYRSADGQRAEVVRARTCISTLPMRELWRVLGKKPDRPPLRWRALRIVYLLYPTAIAGDIDTYYLPDPRWQVGRVSVIGRFDPELPELARRMLTAEIACSEADQAWSLPDHALGELVHKELVATGVLGGQARPPVEVRTVRLADVYPVYDLGWRERWAAALAELRHHENLHLVGRSALFLHCNVDHCMTMARRLSERLLAAPTVAAGRPELDPFPLFELKE